MMTTLALFAAVCAALTALDTASLPASVFWIAIAIAALAVRNRDS